MGGPTLIYIYPIKDLAQGNIQASMYALTKESL